MSGIRARSRRPYPMAPTSRSFPLSAEDKALTKYVRYQSDSAIAYGILDSALDGAMIHEIRGDLFGAPEPTGATHPLSGVKLLYPCEPSKILAVGRNYKSHLGDRQAPDRPEMFYKPVSALQHPDDPIVIPPDAANVHFEGGPGRMGRTKTCNGGVRRARTRSRRWARW